jgi:uncharacterized Zn finger protein
MKCPKCGSEDIKVELMTEQKLKRKKKSLLYWLTIGWMIEPFLWFFLTIPKLFFEIFKPTKYKMQTKTKKVAICQDCGYTWEI